MVSVDALGSTFAARIGTGCIDVCSPAASNCARTYSAATSYPRVPGSRPSSASSARNPMCAAMACAAMTRGSNRLSMARSVAFARLAFSRTVIFDSALAFFITVAMGAFYLAVEGAPASSPAGPAPSRRRDAAAPAGVTPALHSTTKWNVLAWAAIGFGVITKGPVAIALPLLVAIPYAIWRKRASWPWSIKGLIVFACVVAPWVWAISRAVPDFLQYVLVTETMQRLATKALKRTGPPWYFVPFLLFGALPWTVVVVAEGLGGSRSRGTARPRDRDTAQPNLFLVL